MNEENMILSKSETAALEIMEDAREITSDQLQTLKQDEECLQACCDIANAVMGMQEEQDMLAIDTRQALADFHRKHSGHSDEKESLNESLNERKHLVTNVKRKRFRMMWAGAVGIAAIIVVALVMRSLFVTPEPQSVGIQVFQADHTAQQVTLQVSGEKEVKPLKEAVQTFPASTAQLSSHEMDYTIQSESKRIGKRTVQVHKLSIPRGETFKVVLSDGTEVLLNSDSRLSYPTVFRGKERVVSLEGEAYFNVNKDSEHPFIVKCGNVRVRVLGTKFNMRGYSADDVCVTLIEGKVAVSDTCSLQSVEMKPGQSAQLTADGTFAVEEVDVDSFMYWKEGFFYFDDVTLVNMMKEIGRWYNIDIEFRNSKIMNLRMHFVADRRQDISSLIELLNRMERIHAYLESEKLIIE